MFRFTDDELIVLVTGFDVDAAEAFVLAVATGAQVLVEDIAVEPARFAGER